MGRERKPQQGASNFKDKGFSATLAASSLTPRGTHGRSFTPNDSTAFASKSMTFKVIAPDPMPCPLKGVDKHRDIDLTATWKIAKPPGRFYKSITKETYTDPSGKDISNLEVLDLQSEADLSWENERIQKRQQSVISLKHLARHRFGTLANMFRAFNKCSGDAMTAKELADNLKKRSLDVDFPSDKQELLFEEFDRRNEGTIRVEEILGRADEGMAPSVAKKDMLEIRSFLIDEIQKRKEAGEESVAQEQLSKVEEDGTPTNSPTKLTYKQRLEEQKKHTAELTKQAAGHSFFGLDIDAAELNHLVRDVFHKKGTSKATMKFARFLQLTNLNVETIPFYDMREDELSKLKERTCALEEQSKDPEMLARLGELEHRRRILLNPENDLATQRRAMLEMKASISSTTKLGSSSSTPTLSPLKPTQHERAATASNKQGRASRYASQDNGEEEEKDDLGKMHAGRRALHSRDLSGRAQLQSRNGRAVTAPGSPRASLDGGLSTYSSMGNDDMVGRVSRASSVRGGSRGPPIFRDLSESQPIDFSDPHMDVLKANKNNSTCFNPPASPLQLDKIPMYHDMLDSSIAFESSKMGVNMADFDKSINPNHRAQSSSHDYFPALCYEPSQPVTRQLVCDADRDALRRAELRSRRYERKAANMQVTQDRLEYEHLNDEIKQLRRYEGKNEDMLKYANSVFLNDMAKYRKMPLNSYKKRPNYKAGDVMFNGTYGRDDVPENRDFQTTYSSSYLTNNRQADFSNDLGTTSRSVRPNTQQQKDRLFQS